MTRRLLLLWAAALLLLLAPGCDPPTTPPPAAPESRLVVFAAASLRDVFTALGEDLQRARPGVEVTFNFAGTQAMRTGRLGCLWRWNLVELVGGHERARANSSGSMARRAASPFFVSMQTPKPYAGRLWRSHIDWSWASSSRVGRIAEARAQNTQGRCVITSQASRRQLSAQSWLRRPFTVRRFLPDLEVGAWFAFLALAILIVEAWAFHRRRSDPRTGPASFASLARAPREREDS